MTPVHPNGVREGDLIEVQIDGLSFEATVRTKTPKVICIEPTNPIVYLYRYCHYTDIVRVIERPSVNDEKEAV